VVLMLRQDWLLGVQPRRWIEHVETMWRAGCGAAASHLQRRVMEGRQLPSMVGGWRGLTKSDGTREYDVGSKIGW